MQEFLRRIYPQAYFVSQDSPDENVRTDKDMVCVTVGMQGIYRENCLKQSQQMMKHRK